MPQVPIYNQQVKEQALPNARIDATAPIEAFGGGQSAQGLANAVGGVGETVSKVAQLEKDHIDAVQSSAADTKAAAAQTEIQVNVSKMLGRNANGSAEYAKKAWTDSVKASSDGLSGNGLLAFQKAAANRGENLNNFVEKHTSSENLKADDNEFVDRLKVLNASATLNAMDDDQLGYDLKSIHDTVKGRAKLKGIPETLPDGTNNPSYSQLLNQALSTTHRDVIDARLDAGAVNPAFNYLVKNKERMTADDIKYAEKKVEDAFILVDGEKIFKEGLQKRLPGGGIDQAAIFDKISTQANTSAARKEKMVSFVKGLISQENVRQHQQDLDTDNAFKSWVIQQKNAGADISEIVRTMPAQYYQGATPEQTRLEKYKKERLLFGMYSNEKDGDPTAVAVLKEKIQKGQGSYEEIEALKTKTGMSEKSYFGLRYEQQAKEILGIKADRNAALDRMKEDLNRTYPGKGKSQIRKEIQDSVENETVGKSGAEVEKLYIKKKELVPTGKNTWFGIGPPETKPQWQIDREKNKQKFTPGAATGATPEQTNSAKIGLKNNGLKVNDNNIKLWLQKYPSGNK